MKNKKYTGFLIDKETGGIIASYTKKDEYLAAAFGMVIGFVIPFFGTVLLIKTGLLKIIIEKIKFVASFYFG